MQQGQQSQKADGAAMLWCFFGFSGRLSRQAFILAYLFVTLASTYLFSRTVEIKETGIEFTPVGLLVMLVAQFVLTTLAIKRVHDFDRPGILAILLYVPFLNLLFPLFLAIFPGTDGPNRYGEEPNIKPAPAKNE